MKTKFKRLALAATLVLSAILFFVGREAVSRRPVWLQKGGLQALVKHQEWEKPTVSSDEMDDLRARFQIGESDVFAVSDDKKWFLRGRNTGSTAPYARFAVRAVADQKLRSQFGLELEFTEAFFSPDGQWVILKDLDSMVWRTFEAQSGKSSLTFNSKHQKWTPDSQAIVSVNGKTIFTRDARTGKEIYRVEMPNKKPLSDFWFDGPNHIKIADFDDNLWRVRVR